MNNYSRKLDPGQKNYMYNNAQRKFIPVEQLGYSAQVCLNTRPGIDRTKKRKSQR